MIVIKKFCSQCSFYLIDEVGCIIAEWGRRKVGISAAAPSHQMGVIL